MRRRIPLPVPFAQVPPASGGPLSIAGVRAWRLREPDSGRRYTIVRITSQSGASGFGEGGAIRSVEFVEARAALTGRRATAAEFVRNRFAGTPSLEAALSNAMLDLSARAAGVPIYQYLGGPVRFKVRMMARLADPGQAAAAKTAGYRAFTLTTPPRESMSRLQAYVDSIRKSMDDFKKLAGDDAEVVLDGAGALLPGDAAVVARALERAHPIWFDEPTSVISLDALSRITDESTLPVGLGRHIHNIGDFQNLLRLSCVDVLRPSLGLNSLHKIRRMAAIAETHYIAVAPYHDGGPLATMLGIHLGASLSNFYTQEAPIPASPRDRAMRAEILGGVVERAENGFATLVNQPGVGVKLDEQALTRYSEETL
jgi:galactonate dehydratase